MCVFPFQHCYQNKLKLAIIGQSQFGQEVYTSLRKQGHKVVGVFTVPDKDGKADPLGESGCYCLCTEEEGQCPEPFSSASAVAELHLFDSKQRLALIMGQDRRPIV